MFSEIELEKAQEILLSTIKELKTEKEVLENTCGRTLAEDIYAPINVPGFRRSPLDGFALRAEDTKGVSPGSPLAVKIIDEIQAGDTRQITKLPLVCGVKILTGAPLPSEANVVIRKEDVDYINGEIIINKELEKDSNVIFCGSDIKAGEKIFTKGEVIGPYHIGVLAALGLEKVSVYQAPKIGLISTGNELKNPGEDLFHGQIYNSNMYALQALIKNSGGQAYNLGIVLDDRGQIGSILNEALQDYDLLITTGGASVSARYLEVELSDGFSKKSPQRRFLRVKVAWENGKWTANLTGKQDSSILKSMIGCNALIDIPRGSGPIAPKTMVKALLLEEDIICYHL